MLRINKKKEILFRKKERFFSSDLLKALSIALIFHLLFGFFFKISYSLDMDVRPFLEPVSVEIDLSYEPPVMNLPISSKIIPLENTEFPTLLQMPPPNLIVETKNLNERFQREADFSEIETVEYEMFDFEES